MCAEKKNRLSTTRTKSETLKAVITSEYWLILAISGVFFTFFALDGGGTGMFIELSFFLLIVNALFGGYKIKKIPMFYFVVLTVCVCLILESLMVAPAQSHVRWIKNLFRMLIIIFSIHCLYQKDINYRISMLFVGILYLSVCWQFAALHFFEMPYGTFSNRHYLSSFAVLTLPVIVASIFFLPGWYKLILIPIFFMDVELLLQAGSRPAIIGIAFGTLFIIIFLTRGRYKWIGMTLIFLFFGILYITGYANIGPRIEELIVNLTKEERVQFWTQAWNALTNNSLMDWIFGHGIGWFPVHFTQDLAPQVFHFVFPHLYFLEILYLNGIIGVVLIFGGLALLFFSAVNASKQTHNKETRTLLKSLIVAFLSWLIHCGLTIPFYSKNSLYPLAFILGLMLVLVERTTLQICIAQGISRSQISTLLKKQP